MTDAVDDGEVLAGWELGSFTAAGIDPSDLPQGAAGPGVIVVHEIPGITPLVTQFANEVVDAGFTVIMPSLRRHARQVAERACTAPGRSLKVCVAREFTTLALKQTSPIISWLRALARNLHADVGGPGVGAVGMCFAGGFALGMMVDDIMLAPVLSQPSLPFADRLGPFGATSTCRPTMPRRWPSGPRRAVRCSGCASPATGWSATGSRRCASCSATRSSPSSCRAAKKRDHSVLTEQRDDASVERVIEFFREKLLDR